MPAAPSVQVWEAIVSSLPAEVANLVERFTRNRESYKNPAYNETQVRREFLDPLFKALGWDVDNEQGLAEAYKDVIHEDAIKIGGATKAPDYCFRIGGTRKFFLEAKKPAIPLKDAVEPAFQLRRYAWSAKLPLSILTDFEELAVYDCRVRPHKNDKPSQARTMYFQYTEYADRWDELAAVFSRDAVLKGSFDKYAESGRRKRGTAEVDAEFLSEIEGWRDAIARNFALRNKGLSVRELNFAVQRTIDRLIFLRMCEDRGIEPYGQLQALLNGAAVYARLGELFRRADEKYNSSLFYFTAERGRESPDELTLALRLDDRVLKEIIGGLYYPESPYEFYVLPPEILGHVYEQFLGKVIRLTAGGQAKVEEKPEVRKAGGVYYTPTYIVDYIVKHTVGKLLENKTPKQVGPDPSPKRKRGPKAPRGATGGSSASARRRPLPHGRGSVRPLRILDPACGSGSFLLGAYQCLLDWHRDWYVSQVEGRAGVSPAAARQHTDRIYQGAGGQWRLTIQEKKRILLNNIYGVDIDPQAVEVTKLSLLLKVLEGESAETIGSNLRLFHERALPDLSDNIKCGNSLIGPDFYEGQQLSMFDEEERLRINAFDWPAEFPDVFVASGPRTGRPDQSPKRKRGVSQRGAPPPPDDRPVAHAPGSDQARDPNPGFDAVIGNPPYVRQEMLSALKDYFGARYDVYHGVADLYAYFIERGIKLLTVGGLFGMIVSNKWLRAAYGEPLRRFLGGRRIVQIADLAGLPVFAGATVRPIILIACAGPACGAAFEYFAPPPLDVFRTVSSAERLSEVLSDKRHDLRLSGLSPAGWALSGASQHELLELLRERSITLTAYTGRKPLFGVKTGLNEAFVISAAQRDALVRADAKSAEIIKPLISGRDIRRYTIKFKDTYLIFTRRGIDIDAYPAILEHLRQFRRQLTPKRSPRDRLGRKPGAYEWYEIQDTVDYFGEFEVPKIIFPDISTECRFALDDGAYYGTNTTYIIPKRDLYLLGILNSRLAQFAFTDICAGLEGGGATYLRFFGHYLDKFPMRAPRPGSATDATAHDRMVALVQQMLDLHKQLSAAKTPVEQTAIQRQIDATDRQIDQLVYELYGLTDEEIRIVQEATG